MLKTARYALNDADITDSASVCRYLSNVTGVSYEGLLREYQEHGSLLQKKETARASWGKLCRALGVNIDFRYFEEAVAFTS